MSSHDITYEEFVNELRNCTDEPDVHSIIDAQTESLLNDLLGVVDTFTKEKKYFEAEKILQVLANAFNEPLFYSSLALSQKNQYKYEESKANYKKSISLDPSLFKIFYNYGILLFEMKEYEEAIEEFKHSLNLNNDCYLCYYNLGNCYREIHEFNNAKEAYEKAIGIYPEYEDALYNLGVVKEEMNNIPGAIEQYEKTINVNCNNIQAHWNKSLLLLQNGDYLNGFKEYEWRLKKAEFIREFPFPEWNGQNLSDKKILVYCEQGFGDSIQFLRFISLLSAKYIAVECRKELKPLFESLEYIDEVVIRDLKVYDTCDYDCFTSIMSLPYKLSLDINSINGSPYLFAEKYKSDQWRKKFCDSGKFKLGIVCSGNPTHQNDMNRSIKPELLLENLGAESIDIYSLQVNPNKKTREIFSRYGVIDLSEYIKDFSDTAAIIENLDLVISVDTSVAHLAGAMGKSTWILLPYNPDWRWQLRKSDSHWYESVKLFRQDKKHNWNEVLENIKISLNKIIPSDNNNINEDITFKSIYKSIEYFINKNDLENALKELEAALKQDSNPYRAFNYLGILFAKTKNYIKAEEYCIKALNLKSDFPEALSNLAIIYFEQNRFEESISLHLNAIKLNSENDKSYFNLAYAYQESGEINNAITNYEKSISLNPGFADAHFNLSLLKLLKGEYRETWSDYNKWAFISGNRTIRNFNGKIWEGENFEDKKLYVYPDQGLGDVIQLIRYLPLVKERGGTVVFECQPELYDLLKNIPGPDYVVEMKSNFKITQDYDYHIPLQNLPEIFNTGLDTIPDYSSCLKPSDEVIEKWSNKVGSNNFKIGFAWKGNPYPPINRKRHAKLEDLIPLFQIKNVEFYNLQIDSEDNELNKLTKKYNIIDFTRDIKNFEDTAGLIYNLDLVISIDTSVAHLAGAMCKNVFTLLPFIPDWRWGMKLSSTPWYKSMKLFRQAKRADWTDAINNVIDALKKEI